MEYSQEFAAAGFHINLFGSSCSNSGTFPNFQTLIPGLVPTDFCQTSLPKPKRRKRKISVEQYTESTNNGEYLPTEGDQLHGFGHNLSKITTTGKKQQRKAVVISANNLAEFGEMSNDFLSDQQQPLHLPSQVYQRQQQQQSIRGDGKPDPFSPECSIPLPFQIGDEYGYYGPTSIWKRNERERHRVRCVNDGYERLRNHLPLHDSEKRLSKVETLRLAIRYIRHLEKVLEDEAHMLTCNCELYPKSDGDLSGSGGSRSD